MYGIIYLRRVKPDRLAEHESLMKAILQAERERCPELLLHLAFGPAADGTVAEIQVFADETASRGHLARVAREEPELARLRARREELQEPDGSQTFPFEGLTSLSESFIRQAASIGFV